MPTKGHVQTGTQVLVHGLCGARALSLSQASDAVQVDEVWAGSLAHFASGCLERLDIDIEC